MNRFLFPRWVNKFLVLLAILILGGGAYAGTLFLGATDPKTLNPGYSPHQPVPFSHRIHAGQLKMDCRYCHTSVEKAAHASVPATSTCINCHSPLDEATKVPALSAVHPASPKLKALHDSWKTGDSVPWVRIHRLPDFVYFNHSVHVSRGVSCVTCHGRIDKMDEVYQAKELSMTWCVDCHRNPEAHLRDPELVTKLDWKPENGEDPAVLGARLKQEKNINPQANCAVCHR